MLLGVNIDHVATIRQARGTRYPDPIKAALDAEEAGADGITLHLREDYRHIQERDVVMLKELLQTRMNLELAVTDEMICFAEKIRPEHVCLVPEKREELTTEGGLNVTDQMSHIAVAVDRLTKVGCKVSLFVDPDIAQIEASKQVGATTIELHTGRYADALLDSKKLFELQRITDSVSCGLDHGLIVNAGHGLNYHNVQAIAGIAGIQELNIGHALISQAFFVGLKQAIKEMKYLISQHSIA